jgi:hypothetical protein
VPFWNQLIKVIDYMFKSDDEIDVLLNHKNNGIVHRGLGKGQNPNSGGHAGDNKHTYDKIELEDKAKLGTLAAIIGNKNASELTGVHPVRLSQFKNGMNGSKPDEELRPKLLERKAEIQETCISKVDLFLGMLTADRIEAMDTKDIAGSAEKIVNIYEKLGPKNPDAGNKIMIQFFAPKVRELDEMQVIEVEPAVN